MQTECQGCFLRDKQIKVVQVELQFEIKKLTEDMALQKVRLEMAHQKEIKKWTDRLAFTKNERQMENKSWMQKYDAMTQHYESLLKKTEKNYQHAVAQAQAHMHTEQRTAEQQNEARIKKEVAQIREESQDYKRKLLHAKEEQKKYLLKIHEQEIAKMAQRHKIETAAAQQEKKELNKIINELQALQQNTKLTATEISQQLIDKKTEAQTLREKVRALEHKIKFYFEVELANRDKEIAKMRVDHQHHLTSKDKEFAHEKEQLIKKMTKEKNQILEDALQKEYLKCLEYEKKLKFLDEQRQSEISLYQQQLDDLRSTAEEKLIPKSLFHEEISTLKGRLTSKQKDIERAKQQIKQCKLQIQNNEEILNKFFKTSINHTHTAPDIFVNTPKKKDYKIKKSRISVSGAGFLDVPSAKGSNITSMECLDKVSKDFESFRIL